MRAAATAGAVLPLIVKGSMRRCRTARIWRSVAALAAASGDGRVLRGRLADRAPAWVPAGAHNACVRLCHGERCAAARAV